ncbi:hypothetical protein K4L44_04300 [Halosquirtibacter laminarini]|uniref:Uncharacterized protein n=1 Tax=Halosquirtibacter laminarini TaxID=3374600 RepID=A0AC61NHC9_9BACT|nr:hypothetical protein K4L44_04300 [Prolixibacteraceae bacterium]
MMRKNNSLPKTVVLTGSIIAIVTFVLLKIFLDGKIIDIPKGTSKEAIISAVGCIVIIITTVTVAVFVLLLIKKHNSKTRINNRH